MKMKLAQRLLIGYYKTKLKAIGLVSARKAAEAAFRRFCTPFGQRSIPEMPPAFEQAEGLSLKVNGLTVRGFRFKPGKPNGKKVLVAHGFSSYSYRFVQYIPSLTRFGFEVLAFDAPAHGLSDGKIINAAIYSDTLLAIEKEYGPLYGIIGHSLGGLAAALAVEKLDKISQRKLVLIAPATETETTLKGFFKLVPLDEKVQQAFRNLVTEIAGQPVSYFSVSRVVKKIKSPVLWVHDRNDPVCPFRDVKPLLSLDLPHVRFCITEHLGHSKVYKNEAVIEQVTAFLNGTND